MLSVVSLQRGRWVCAEGDLARVAHRGLRQRDEELRDADRAARGVEAAIMAGANHERRARVLHLRDELEAVAFAIPRFNEEIKRRTHVVRLFPHVESCLRLVRVLAAAQREQWQEGSHDLNMHGEGPQISGVTWFA